MPCNRSDSVHSRGRIKEDARELSAELSPPHGRRPCALLQEEGELQLHIPHVSLFYRQNIHSSYVARYDTYNSDNPR